MQQYVITLCGMPASGKSYLAKRICSQKQMKILSMDDFRTLLPNKEYDQNDTYQVFQKMHSLFLKEVLKGKNIIIDNTNLKASRRKIYCKEAKEISPNIKTICIFIDAQFDDCIKNNNNENRTHIVPMSYYEKIQNRWSYPTLKEGWDEIYIIDINYQTNQIKVKEKIVA